HRCDVVGDRHVREEPDLLDDVADPSPQRDRGQFAHAEAVDADVSSPSSSGTSRFTSFSAVVLPQPDGPTRTQNAPAGISSERSRSAGSARPAYRFVTRSNTISAPPMRACSYPSGEAIAATGSASRRYWCTNAIAMLPSPTAAATRFTGL